MASTLFGDSDNLNSTNSRRTNLGSDHFIINNGFGNGLEVSRKDIQDAIDKAVELRALHAALLHGTTPSARHPRIAVTSSPLVTRSSSTPFASKDYPVFMPIYGDKHYLSEIRNLSGTWDDFRFGSGNVSESVVLDYGKEKLSLRKGFGATTLGYESHICPVDDDQNSMPASLVNIVTNPEASPGLELYNSGQGNILEDVKSVSSHNRCRQSVITSIQSNTIVPSTNPLPLVLPQQMKGRHGSGGGVLLSWLLPWIKKKHKSESSPNRTESEEVSQGMKDLGTVSIEALKKELIEAHEHRDAALMEVAEMRSSLGEVRDKLEYLETYCEGLKKALKQAMEKESRAHLETRIPTKGKSVNSAEDWPMPVSEEAMKEGFQQVVSEARVSAKQFCKTLIGQVDEADRTLTECLDSLLGPFKLSIGSRYSKAVLYHLEAIINQSLYQDFENCVFRRNCSSKILDPHQNRKSRFAAFVSLRNLSWNEVLRKGTKYYSEEFSQFCDQKMGSVISTLNWTRPWPGHLLQAFFMSAKCVWLLHLLAFSFDPPIRILRVEEGTRFDSRYMEDVFAIRQRPQGPSLVKAMVVPGFYVDDRVLRCEVVCRV